MFISSITVGLLAATVSLGAATGISCAIDRFRQEKLFGKLFSMTEETPEEEPKAATETTNKKN